MEMGSLPQRQYFECELKQKKCIQKYPRETLYLRWINYKVKLLYKDIDKAGYGEMEYEDLFWGDKVKELTSIFKNFLNMKKKKNFTNFNNINIKVSYVEKIIDLKIELYYLITQKLDVDFAFSDEVFHDFFEEFIIFTRRINLKNFEDYENDIYDPDFISDNVVILSDSDSDSDSENENENLIIFSSDSDSENENENENENLIIFSSDSESENESD